MTDTSGIFFGGLSRGISKGREEGLARRSQDLQEQQFQNQQSQDLLARTDAALDQNAKFLSDTILRLRQEDVDPDSIRSTVQPIVQELESLFVAAKRDPGVVSPLVEGLLSQASRDDLAAGEQPQAGEKASGLPERAPDGADEETRVAAAQARIDAALSGETVPTSEMSRTTEQQLGRSINALQTKTTLIEEFKLFKSLLMQEDNTGAVTEAVMPALQFGNQLGRIIGVPIAEGVTNLEVIQAFANQQALRFRNPDGGFGLTGNTSNRDLIFLKDAAPGLKKTPRANRLLAIMTIAKLRQDAALEQFKARLISRGQLGLFAELKDDFVDTIGIFTDDERVELEQLRQEGLAVDNEAKGKSAIGDFSEPQFESVRQLD